MHVLEEAEWRKVIGHVGASLIGVHIGNVGAYGGSALFQGMWGEEEGLMTLGEVITRGSAVGGYLNRVIFEGDVGVFPEGGEG